jgi:hypothetical protein
METPTEAGQTTPTEIIKHTYKGTNMNLQCRGFQFEIGKTYTHEGPVNACNSGFHACENPLDVFRYYPPGFSRFFKTEQSGSIYTYDQEDSKIASASIALKAEILLPDFIKSAFDWVLSKCTVTNNHATGDKSASSATGVRSASSATGDKSASSATGVRSASSATGYQSASSATGYRSASSATGDNSASSATGYQSVAMNIGFLGKAKASENGAIVVCNHDDQGNLRHIRASKVGDNGIKPNTFYILNDLGEFEEAQN